MATWDEMKSNINRWTSKLNQTVDELTDRAALQFKLSARRGDLEKEYTTLGKLTYQKLSAVPGDPADAAEDEETNLTAQINQAMTRITAIRAEIAELEKRLQ